MRIRLRPKHSDEYIEELYAKPHDHLEWKDHVVRVELTLALVRHFEPLNSVADLSCGNGWIIDRIDAPVKFKGDFAPGYEIQGPIEETIDQIPRVNLFILSETLEHVDDPDLVLRKIREKSDAILLSTPSNETDPYYNPEHYWGWDTEELDKMLRDAGFTPTLMNHLHFPTSLYDFQIWGAR